MIERNAEAPIKTWAAKYLDSVDKHIMAEAKLLDARWREIAGVFQDLELTPTNVKKKYEIEAKYKEWLALFKGADETTIPYGSAFLEEPGEYLASIEKGWKGTRKGRWKPEMHQWGRKGSGWA